MALVLSDRMHGEGTGPVKPLRVAGPSVKFEKRVAVACRAVAEAGAFRQWTGLPYKLAAFLQELIESCIQPSRNIRKASDHPRRAMAMLNKHFSLLNCRNPHGGPVSAISTLFGRRRKDVVDA